MLLSFMCKWMGVTLLSLDVHGGTTEREIIDVFHKADEALQQPGCTSVYVFLDEVNTCVHMGVINEAICHRSLNGHRIADGVQILAALNPYRLRPEREEMGLVDNNPAAAAAATAVTFPRAATGSNTRPLSSTKHETDILSKLVYRVHPIPPTLRDFIFDFGSLEPATELLYIQSMIQNEYAVDVLPSVSSSAAASASSSSSSSASAMAAAAEALQDKKKELNLIGQLIHASQEFVRNEEGDPSVVSLRDVKRVLVLMKWFEETLTDASFGADGLGMEPPNSPARATSSSSSTAPRAAAKGHAAGASAVATVTTIELTDAAGRKFKYEVPSTCRAAVLAMAHVYCYRLYKSQSRDQYWETITKEAHRVIAKYESEYAQRTTSTQQGPFVSAFKCLAKSHTDGCGLAAAIITRAQKQLVDNLEVESGVSMNQALTENLFVSIVCIINKIPIFIVGKPGTSKTLCMKVVQSNLQGKQSPKKYWQSFPAINLYQYQCSPLSTSESIKYQFESARSNQEHSQDQLTVLLLDEVGLAEFSPDMPLKVLHYMLIDPPIAIVGISNWALDSSKMNRAICLQRPEPSESDIMLTGENIVSASNDAMLLSVAEAERQVAATATAAAAPPARGGKRKNAPAVSINIPKKNWLGSLAKAYHYIYSNQRTVLNSTRDFIGMRDYYGLLSLLRMEKVDEIHPALLARAVARNFGGRPEALKKLLEVFHKECFINNNSTVDLKPPKPKRTKSAELKVADECPVSAPTTTQLIKENLDSANCRHLMVLGRNENTLQLLFGCGLIDESSVSVLVGSRFKEDKQELYLIQQVNSVKQAMAAGRVAVLMNNESIYESLYDVLNQRYVSNRDPNTNIVTKQLRLAMGPRSQLCPVREGFKLIVIVQENQAYENLDLPLLNRFGTSSYTYTHHYHHLFAYICILVRFITLCFLCLHREAVSQC